MTGRFASLATRPCPLRRQPANFPSRTCLACVPAAFTPPCSLETVGFVPLIYACLSDTGFLSGQASRTPATCAHHAVGCAVYHRPAPSPSLSMIPRHPRGARRARAKLQLASAAASSSDRPRHLVTPSHRLCTRFASQRSLHALRDYRDRCQQFPLSAPLPALCRQPCTVRLCPLCAARLPAAAMSRAHCTLMQCTRA